MSTTTPDTEAPLELRSLLTDVRYHRGEQIGRGIAGEVYHLLTIDDQPTFSVVKLTPTAGDDLQDAQEQIMVEYQLLRLLKDSPYVVEVQDVIRSGSDPALAHWGFTMPHQGRTLLTLLRRVHDGVEQLSNQQRHSLCFQLAAAVGHLHQLDIYYGDFKPDNVMVNAAGELKLIDFSHARVGSYQMPWAPANFGYVAPEVAIGFRYTRAADIWSLGLLMANIQAGVPVFSFLAGASIGAQMTNYDQEFGRDGYRLAWYIDNQQVVEGRHQIRQLVGEENYGLLGRLLRIAPRERLTIAQVLKQLEQPGCQGCQGRHYQPIETPAPLRKDYQRIPANQVALDWVDRLDEQEIYQRVCDLALEYLDVNSSLAQVGAALRLSTTLLRQSLPDELPDELLSQVYQASLEELARLDYRHGV
jgi:serine/threonine protein kinase